MDPAERADVLRKRQELAHPWHRPPTFWQGGWVHWTAACYEHRSWIGTSPVRMEQFTRDLLRALADMQAEVGAWVVLPNHYHVLLRVTDEKRIKTRMGRLHGSSSHAWNVEDNRTGRSCFHGGLLKRIKSEAHRWSTLHYIHHNPVKHSLVEKWRDWPYSSATAYLESVGESEAKRLWKECPIDGMGTNWDDFPVE